MVELAIIFALIVLNGLFSGAEIAVLTLRKGRLEERAERGSRTARAVLRLRQNPETFLATVQIGITVVGATAAAFGGSTVAERLQPALAPVVGGHAKDVALVVVVGLISYLSLVIGELVPKSLALRYPELFAAVTARLLEALAKAGRPAVWFLTTSSNVVLRLFGDRTTFAETRLSPEELRQLLEEASESGSLDARVSDLAVRALDFGDLTTRDVMAPRRQIEFIDVDATHEEVLEALRTTTHSNLIVFEGNADNVLGSIPTRRALQRATLGKPLAARDDLHPAYFVPEGMSAIDLLQAMSKGQQYLAIVIDEHGGTVGIVSIIDLVEELVGPLLVNQERPTSPLVQAQPDGSFVVQGAAPLHEVNRTLDLTLPEGDWSTLAGLCLALAGNIPKVGDHLTAPDGSRLEILDATPRRVRSVRIRRAAEPVDPAEAAAPLSG